MNKLMNIRSFLVVIIALIAGAIIGCSDKGPGTSASQTDGNLVINIERSPGEVMGLVNGYVLTVSGPDMDSVADTVMNAQGGFVVFDVKVPIGERRLFVLEGIQGIRSISPLTIYRGQTVAPVRPGAITTLNIILWPVVPMVRLSPIMPVLAAGQVLELQLEVYNIQNLTAISINFQWPWEILGDWLVIEPAERLGPDVSFYQGQEGGWMSISVADTLGGTIVNQHGNGVLANITARPLTQVGPEGGSGAFGIFEIDTVWSYTLLGNTPPLEQILYEDSEIRILPVPDREVQFADSMLEAEVRRVTSVQAPQPIMLSDVTLLTSFSVTDLNVQNLSGLENLVNLASLSISYNFSLRDITPLAHLTRLVSLDATNSAIDDVAPLAGLTDMRYLRLNENAITNISPLSGLIELYNLELNLNQITDISPLAGLVDLEWLYLSDNMIGDISALADLPKLYRLGLGNNMISDILPLVDNAELGPGDVVDLWGNTSLANDPIQLAHVTTLRTRGVTVNMIQPAR